tara:strand:+ start:345 stop:1286 length:942 start_codon:yes stop_codon:yes gene_type:complete
VSKDIKNLYNKHINKPCVIVGSSKSLNDFDYQNFKGIKIVCGATILRINKEFNPNYLISSNTIFPIPNIPEHIRIINSFNKLTWIISDTGTFCDIWDFQKKNFKKIKNKYFFFDERHFFKKKCVPLKKCCSFIEKYPNRTTINETLSNLAKVKFKVPIKGISIAEHALSLALILGCNPIFIQGVDLPKKHYSAKKINKKYYGAKSKKADEIIDTSIKLAKKKYKKFYFKNYQIKPYVSQIIKNIYFFFTNKSEYDRDYNNSKQIFNWLGKIAIKNKKKVYILSKNSMLRNISVFKYMNFFSIKYKYSKFFKKT